MTILRRPATQSSAARSASRLRGAALATLCGALSIGGGACASAAPFNPEGLRADQLSRVGEICQSVMGLSPSEPLSLVWGAATNPGISGGENHYQGCVASLSASLRSVDSGNAAWRADQDCRARGLKSDSPQLALCVLQTTKDGAAITSPPQEPVSFAALRPAGSFFTASRHNVADREQRACAALGLNPAYGAFDGCVRNLSDTFDSIDNPRN